MLKLYGGARSRASIVKWYLEELQLPYEFVLLDMQAGEHRQPAYLAINPIGKVPALSDREFHLWESGAILLYLAEKYGEPGLSPERRATLNQWIHYANATLGLEIFHSSDRDQAVARHLSALNELLPAQPFLAGETLSVADVAVGAVLAYAQLMLQLDFSAYPAVTHYCQQLADRPAFQASIMPKPAA